jgi:transcriptional regulator with XRE-family HTH domain
MSAATATYDAANVVASRLEKLGLSVNTFIGLTGDSKAQMSRYLSGQVPMPAKEIERLYEALNVLEKLFEAFYPFKPDLRDGDICGPLIRDFSKGLVTVKVDDFNALIRKGSKFEGGLTALASRGESGAKTEKTEKPNGIA